MVVIVWSASLTLGQHQDEVRDESQTLAVSVAAYLDLVMHIPAEPADLAAAQAVLASIPLPANSVITVADEHGVVIARSRDAERYIGAAGTIGQHAETAWTGVRRGVDGVNRICTIASIGRSTRLVSVGLPLQLAVDRTIPIYRRNLTVVWSTAAVLLTITLVIAWRWVRAVTFLEAAADRVGRGDLESFRPATMPSREFERLQDTFAGMIARLREARDTSAGQVAEERRMREEMASLQRQIIRQERLAAIGVLVSGVAHEINNPLQVVYGFTEILLAREDLPEDVYADLAMIEKESARAAAIIRNLTRFGRQKNAQPAPVLMRDIVASVMELRQRKLQEQDIAVEIDDHAHSPVLAVFTELQQVLLNFVINAEQAMDAADGVRRITIRTADDRGRVRVEVEDTGKGVAHGNESKLFQPFFTTKPVGEGTGLGLSVSYGIIEGYGGTIGYRRAAIGGALFYFELPAAG